MEPTPQIMALAGGASQVTVWWAGGERYTATPLLSIGQASFPLSPPLAEAHHTDQPMPLPEAAPIVLALIAVVGHHAFVRVSEAYRYAFGAAAEL